MKKAPPTLSSRDAARLLLGAQGLLEAPSRKATPEALRRLLERLGFVQLDSINTVARAHDLILWSRLHGYRPEHLRRLLEEERHLFEHWTHDASAIPTAWYAHWKPRFHRDRERIPANRWWRNLLGADSERVCATVLERIAREGPLRAADFEHPERRGPWWGWKPQKAALDYLWRCGQLAVRGRVHFHKVYDLAERVHPQAHAAPEPSVEEHVQWACRTAAERLYVFTPRELAAFWQAIEAPQARGWCEAAERTGHLVRVVVESADGSKPQQAYAVADWRERLERLPEAPEGLRLLAPFDPVVRDRARALRRFGFDYRFEAFTPEAKRQYGYYVLPLLEGERLVGRIDPKLHRERSVLEVKGPWWEPGTRPTRARLRALEQALWHLADLVGAEHLQGL
jgi:uncharacterized protein